MSLDSYRNRVPEHKYEKYHALQAGEVFVEVGAYIGNYVAKASRVGCRVIAIEPDPRNVVILREVIQAENLQNVTVIPEAVNLKSSRENFILMSDSTGSALEERWLDDVQDKPTYEGDVGEVKTDTLEHILDQTDVTHVDLLASDCENCEVQLVQGAGRWIREGLVRNWAIGAYHRPENAEAISKLLSSHDYRVLGYEEGVVYACLNSPQ